VINDENQTPCEDSDSMDLAYARIIFKWLRDQGYGTVSTEGFSQNALWSL
jgi:hypothetical protein